MFLKHKQPKPRDREDGEEPAEVDEPLELARVAGQEVAERRRVPPDLRIRPLCGVTQRECPDRHSGQDSGACGERTEPRPPPCNRVGEHERDRAQREVHLTRERDRRECGGREPRQATLDPVQRERQQHRDGSEEVPRRLRDAVRRECEREPADERSREREAERTQPERGEAACSDVGQEHEDVPAGDRPEQRLERAEDRRERPAGEVGPPLELGLEAVGVDPRRLAAGELVAGEPEAVDRLQVVARRDASLGRDAVAQEAIVGAAEGR